MMSILNIGFQNVALVRKESAPDEEIKKCKDLPELGRNKAIKDDWQKSIQPLVQVLEERTTRLILNDIPFKVILYLSAFCIVSLKNHTSHFRIFFSEKDFSKYTFLLSGS